MMKEAFWNKITAEYKSYQVSVLSCANIEIYGKCYEINTILNFYEILIEKMQFMSEIDLSILLEQDNILMELYADWLKREDNNYSEMENHIAKELEVMIGRKME